MTVRINELIALFLIFIILVGCSTLPTRTGKIHKAQWNTKALINNLREGKSQSVTIDFLAVRNAHARLEISGLMGFQLASFVLSPQEISYIIYPQKTYFKGPNTERALGRMIALQINPMNLANIAFDEPIRGPGWRCDQDQEGLVSQCGHEKKKIFVKWLDRENGKKKVSILAPQFEMKWNFSAPQTEVQFKSETFILNRPEGFKLVEIK
jgi:hypothetical protein